MTSIQLGALNDEIQRNLGAIADDEALLKRVANYLRRIAKRKEDPTQMSKEEFFAKLDKAERDITNGKGKRFDNLDDMNTWLKSL